MPISIHPGGTINTPQRHSELSVPPAVVWAGGLVDVAGARKVRVRTLDSSNGLHFDLPQGGTMSRHGALNGVVGTVRRDTICDKRTTLPDHAHRSIAENAKQWAGGALFGLAIFGGLVLSQQGQGEPIPSYSESQMVGVNLN